MGARPVSYTHLILLEYAKKNHFPNPVFFVDDGYSGTNYDRPGFQSMLVEIEAGRVGTVSYTHLLIVLVLSCWINCGLNQTKGTGKRDEKRGPSVLRMA